MNLTERSISDKGSRILVDPQWVDSAGAEWFDPGYWGHHAVSVDSGGRGSAWFIDSPSGDWVLRHYRRGGLPGKLSERKFFFAGAARTRSFAEFRLLARLNAMSLPVPKPVAAEYQRLAFGFYRASILVQRIAGAVPIKALSPDVQPEYWAAAGRVVRRFHDAGLDHVDLNVDNILVSGNDIYLIDFDRCRFRNSERSSSWKTGNLARLLRSIEKNSPEYFPKGAELLWREFLKYYGEAELLEPEERVRF